MYLRRMVSQAIGLGLMVTLVILALSACGGGGSAQEEKQANKVHHIETSQTHPGKPLPAGHYVTKRFRPTMSFDLDTGWTRGTPELRDAWDIRDTDNDAYWLAFFNAEEVYKPNGSGGMKFAPAPENMVAWLQTNPFLKTEKSTPVKVGGEKATQIDALVADKAPPEPPAWCHDCHLVLVSAGLVWSVYKGEKLRFIVVEHVKGQTVTIIEETTPAGFKEFTAKSQKVLDSVKWENT